MNQYGGIQVLPQFRPSEWGMGFRGQIQDETFVIQDIDSTRRRGHRHRMNTANPDVLWRRRHINPPAPTMLVDETVIIDNLYNLARRRFMAPPPPMLGDETVIIDDLGHGHPNNAANVDDVRGQLSEDEEQRKNSLSSEIWQYLKTENYECGGPGGGDGFCAVCQSEFDDGDKLGKLSCGHRYHAPCIHTWLMQKNLCPVCKRTAISELQS